MNLGQVKPFWLNPPCLFRKSINRSPRTLSLRRSRENKPKISSKWRVSLWRSRNSLDGPIRKPTLQLLWIDKTKASQSSPNPRNAFLNPGVPPMLQTILIVLLILFLLGGVGTLPNWPHSRNWGYGPSGGLSLISIIILVLLVLLFTKRI